MTEPNLLVLVNGPAQSVQSPRARALFGEGTELVYKERGRLGSIGPFRKALQAFQSGCIYCIDLGFPAAPLAALRRSHRPAVRLVYELGDPATPLLANQNRSKLEVFVADQMDRRLPLKADRLVFRGSYLAEYFEKLVAPAKLPPWKWIPDGVDCRVFRPCRQEPEVAALRRAQGWENSFVVGIVGNIHHNPRHNLFYGWELAEALARLPPESNIRGAVVGDGPGRPVLEATCVRLGLGDRLKLLGRVPHEQVPLWMNAFDLGLSTQTDDPVGWGRTTAKLPEYLACGLPVISSDVGEAHRLLTESGQTLPYRGMRDDEYPARLAARLQELAGQSLVGMQQHNRALAERMFDYPVLSRELHSFLQDV